MQETDLKTMFTSIILILSIHCLNTYIVFERFQHWMGPHTKTAQFLTPKEV